MDDVELIHMGGRIYDPTLGRFMQADPIVQAPSDSQSYNRFAYVRNNPMSMTDPSGFSWWTNIRDKYLRPILAIVATIYLGPAAQFFLGNVVGAALTGFVAGGIATGSLRGAVVGALTGAMFGGIGDAFAGKTMTASLRAGKTLLHGMAGGISSVLSGGKFGHGFAAAGFTQAVSQDGRVFVDGDRVGNAVKAAAIGGTASVITGGKFANGAVTGAFSRMLNDEMHSKKRDFSKARNHDELLAMVKGEEYKHELLVTDNTLFDELGAYDAVESVLNSLKENLDFNLGVEAAYGSGVTALGTFNMDGDIGYDVAYSKGVIVNPIGSVGGTVYSSGEISGFYQSFNLCAIGCINIIWNYQNYSVGTSIGFGIGVTLETGVRGD